MSEHDLGSFFRLIAAVAWGGYILSLLIRGFLKRDGDE